MTETVLNTPLTPNPQPVETTSPDGAAQQPPLTIWLRVADALESIAAFGWLAGLVTAFISPLIAAISFIAALASFFAALLFNVLAEERIGAGFDEEELRTRFDRLRVARLRREMRASKCLITTERIAELKNNSVAEEIITVLTKKQADDDKDDAGLAIGGADLLDLLDRRLGTDRVDDELQRIFRAVRLGPLEQT